jgi:hypothetical protein
VEEVGCAASSRAEVVVEQVEERLHSEVTCVFATGSGIESPTAGLDGDAWFVLYPVGVVVPVAAAAAVVVVVAVCVLVDPKAKCFVGAEHSEMIAHGKTIVGLTLGRWKEFS